MKLTLLCLASILFFTVPSADAKGPKKKTPKVSKIQKRANKQLKKVARSQAKWERLQDRANKQELKAATKASAAADKKVRKHMKKVDKIKSGLRSNAPTPKLLKAQQKLIAAREKQAAASARKRTANIMWGKNGVASPNANRLPLPEFPDVPKHQLQYQSLPLAPERSPTGFFPTLTPTNASEYAVLPQRLGSASDQGYMVPPQSKGKQPVGYQMPPKPPAGSQYSAVTEALR